MKFFISAIIILITATIGILVKQCVGPQHYYIIGWIFGCLSIALCRISEAIIDSIKEDINE